MIVLYAFQECVIFLLVHRRCAYSLCFRVNTNARYFTKCPAMADGVLLGKRGHTLRLFIKIK